MATRDEEAAVRSEILLRDAEEALAQERMREFWRQWGGTLVGMALMLVIGTGAGVAWREWREGRNEKSTSQLIDVVLGDKYAMSDKFGQNMSGEHAAIAWLAGAGTDAKPEEKEQFFARAAATGGDSGWGWLGRWNALRARMDDPKQDPVALIHDYEALAKDADGKALAALAYTDAAVIAGERKKDPKEALDFLAKAEKITGRSSQMGMIVGDLKHLYEVRAQSLAPADAPAANEEEKQAGPATEKTPEESKQ